MNYIVKCDDEILYNKYIDSCLITESELHQVDNDFGSFDFTIYDTHPLYNSIVMKRSRIKIYKNGTLIWLGRPYEVVDTIDDAKRYFCEGCMSYLKDSVMRPFDFSGPPESFFAFVLNTHNAYVAEEQQLGVGDCTVTDPNDYIVRSLQNYENLWNIVLDRMLNIGGHLVITFDDDEKPILNWYAEMPYSSTQRIRFGENLVEYERSLLYSEFYTACIPLGVKDETTGERLTIKAVNDGKDYLVNDVLAATYGVIYADPNETVWDDVTVASNLKSKGQAWLNTIGVRYKRSVTLTAEDISFLMNDAAADFEFLQNVIFETKSGSAISYLIVDLTVDVCDPYSVRVVISDESSDYAESSLSRVQARGQLNAMQRLNSIESSYVTSNQANAIAESAAIHQIQTSSYIKQTIEGIIIGALEEYTRTSDFEAFKSSVVSNLSIMAGEISANFASVTESVSNLSESTQAEFDAIYSFIRLLADIQESGSVVQEGGVVIGNSSSDIKLKLQNNVLYFFTGDERIVTTDNAIAWFATNQLYVNNTSIQNLTLGTGGAYLDARIVGSGDNVCVLWSGRLS